MSQIVDRSIEHLNADCTCITLDRSALCRAFVEAVGDKAFCEDLFSSRPHLICNQPLFLSPEHAAEMQGIIDAIEALAMMPAYQEEVLSYAPQIARFRPGPIGVFMGYDFHLGPDGPKLIEINTNAGGALINGYLLQAQQTCCAAMATSIPIDFDLDSLLTEFVDSFKSEWCRQGRAGPLRSIAIVDDTPQSQYLYPEFILFQRLLERHGIEAVIAAPDQLLHRDHGLWVGGRQVDLVYNRLTDFDLSQPANRVLRDAYLADEIVLTPNPWVHAIFADKRDLVLMSDADHLRRLGVDTARVAELLRGIPRTLSLTPENAEELWSRRDTLFFKPRTGYGSKAAYRGDKITRKVWSEIMRSSYVAQEIVSPSARTISIDGAVAKLKVDLRSYTFAGRTMLNAARLYQGQTTNFRTAGGGFAPVFVGNDDVTCKC